MKTCTVGVSYVMYEVVGTDNRDECARFPRPGSVAYTWEVLSLPKGMGWYKVTWTVFDAAGNYTTYDSDARTVLHTWRVWRRDYTYSVSWKPFVEKTLDACVNNGAYILVWDECPVKDSKTGKWNVEDALRFDATPGAVIPAGWIAQASDAYGPLVNGIHEGFHYSSVEQTLRPDNNPYLDYACSYLTTGYRPFDESSTYEITDQHYVYSVARYEYDEPVDSRTGYDCEYLGLQ